MDVLINRFNQYRKKKYFSSVFFRSAKKYAFIGVGMHSLTNLYPILRHAGIDLTLICTKGSSVPPEIERLFPGCRFTHSVDDILNDPAIEGVFLCASPSSHYTLLKSLLQAGKKVFVEKPPCQTLEELQSLAAMGAPTVCKVGLQRRYWPANRLISKRASKAKSYTYSFHTGPYIQGDLLTELFIHPLDYCRFLFGKATITSRSVIKDTDGVTVQAHLVHDSGCSGLVELSTRYSWNAPTESMKISAGRESLLLEYPLLAEGEQRPTRVLKIPAENILDQPVVTRKYFSVKNMILPVANLNTLVLQGFYGELEHFIALVEGEQNGPETNDLAGLISVYEWIEKIRASPGY